MHLISDRRLSSQDSATRLVNSKDARKAGLKHLRNGPGKEYQSNSDFAYIRHATGATPLFSKVVASKLG
jgi:hypothetical protein